MNIRPIKRVYIEFEDGEVEEYALPDSSQGFFRERLSYNGIYNEHGQFAGWTDKLYVYELIWTLTAEQRDNLSKVIES